MCNCRRMITARNFNISFFLNPKNNNSGFAKSEREREFGVFTPSILLFVLYIYMWMRMRRRESFVFQFHEIRALGKERDNLMDGQKQQKNGEPKESEPNRTLIR